MQKIHEKTEIKVSELVAFAGVSKSTWHEWRTRKGIETRHNHETPKLNWYTPEERKAVVKYVLTHKNFLYGYSRKILDWALCENMEGINIELLVARVKEKYPEAKARIIHDNGKQFISKDFKSLVSLLELYETAARVCHPQSNGKLERFHSTLKTEHVLKSPYFSYEDAKEKMAQWIDFYNNGRLHGTLLYLTPADYFEGRKESRLAERREKLHTADINRKAYRLQQQQA